MKHAFLHVISVALLLISPCLAKAGLGDRVEETLQKLGRPLQEPVEGPIEDSLTYRFIKDNIEIEIDMWKGRVAQITYRKTADGSRGFTAEERKKLVNESKENSRWLGVELREDRLYIRHDGQADGAYVHGKGCLLVRRLDFMHAVRVARDVKEGIF